MIGSVTLKALRVARRERGIRLNDLAVPRPRPRAVGAAHVTISNA